MPAASLLQDDPPLPGALTLLLLLMLLLLLLVERLHPKPPLLPVKKAFESRPGGKDSGPGWTPRSLLMSVDGMGCDLVGTGLRTVGVMGSSSVGSRRDAAVSR